MLPRELDKPVDGSHYRRDSTTVLRHIRNEKKRFQVFVANWVQMIQDATNPHQWRYVESKRNPADDASHGLEGQELYLQCCRITGSNFLWLPETKWPWLPFDLDDISVENPEIKKIFVHSTSIDENKDFLARLTRFSKWHQLKRPISWILPLKPMQSITGSGKRRGGHHSSWCHTSDRTAG